MNNLIVFREGAEKVNEKFHTLLTLKEVKLSIPISM